MTDPFTWFEGGVFHRADIALAEAVTGVPGRTICRHAVDPLVQMGVSEQVAVAGLHWMLVGWGLTAVGVGLVLASRRA